MQKFWKLTNAVDRSESTLYLEGPISEESWWGDEVTPQAFRDELKEIKSDKLTVVLNSGGGDVFAGLSIYNALRELDAEVTIRVDGLAASIASVIAMAGDKVIMSPGSMMMIHKPSVFAMGNSEDLEKAIEVLNTIEESIVPIYTAKSGQTKEKIVEMLESETWMSAENAIELGFADELATIKEKETTNAQNAFSGNFAFSMQATKDSIDNFVQKMAASQNPSEEEDEESEVVTTPQPTVEPAGQPTEPNTVQPLIPEQPEVQPPVEPEVEQPQSTEPTNSIKDKETIEMSKQDELAQAQVIEPAAQAPVNETAKVKNYLKSKESLQDFANVLAENAGKDAAVVKAAWADHVKVKMDITNPEVLLPGAVVQSITDAFAEGGDIWNVVNKTGLDVFAVMADTVTGEDSRAKGHTRGDTKTEEVITLDDRTIRAQFIYKYLTLSKETVRENRSTGALLRYVLSELPKRIVRELERAIVIGDGRLADSDHKVKSFVSLKADAADGTTGYATTFTPTVGMSRYESLVRARALVRADGPVYMVAKSGFMTETLLAEGSNGGYLFQPGANVAAAFNVAGVVTPDWMDDDAENDAYLFVGNAYRTVGDNSVEAFSNFILKENKNEYLQEIYAGGALTELNAAVAIAETPTV